MVYGDTQTYIQLQDSVAQNKFCKLDLLLGCKIDITSDHGDVVKIT